jgi:hypothetical protein
VKALPIPSALKDSLIIWKKHVNFCKLKGYEMRITQKGPGGKPGRIVVYTGIPDV